MDRDKSIYIVGGGIAGLIAAFELEQRGYAPIIIETSDRAGGKLKTDSIDGYLLDRGFQVLLTAYPEAKRYLDYSSLDLQSFLPGAEIFKGGKRYTFGDPLRNWSMAPTMLMSPIGSITDKIKIFALTQKLKRKPIKKIFDGSRITTSDYLMDKKFSGSIIENFFRPFFGGIYLDKELGVSTKMFKFVFKMFAEGNATIPAKGIESIPQQLKSKLTKTQFRFNQRVKNITGKQIALQNGQILEADKIIVAANPHTMIRGLWNQKLDFNSVINLYFESNINFLEKPLIGLVPGKNNLINNFYFKNSLAGTDQSETNLLSVTIVGNQEIDDQLISEAIKEIRSLANQPGMKLKYVHGYRIPKALPQLIDLDYTVSPNTTKLTENIYLAGDYMLYPSLNAAMTSGRLAAEAVASTF